MLSLSLSCHIVETYDCQYDGLVSMSPCFFGAPVYFSKVNMRGVDRRIRSLIDESTINYDGPEKQSFYIDQVSFSLKLLVISFR